MTDIIGRTHRFAKFLRSAVAVKSKPVVEVNKYPFVLWFSEFPQGLQELRSPILTAEWQENDFDWLVVRRVVEPKRPNPPEECLPWLDGVNLDEPSAPPVINVTRTVLDDLGQPEEGTIPEAVQAQFSTYVNRAWIPWAEKAKVARAIGPVYKMLFSICQELKGKEDVWELYIGVGLLDFRRGAERRHRHLLAFPAEIRLDDKSGTITVGPSPDVVAPRAELEFLDPAERGRLERLLESRSGQLEEVWPSVHDRRLIQDQLLAPLTNNLSDEAQYRDDLSPISARPDSIMASYAPALVMRPKTTKSLDELLAKIEKDTAGTTPRITAAELPTPWRRMMEHAAAWQSPGDKLADATGGSLDRVFFPLPSNEEQSKIVRHASGSAGVVVQGPPGTGKSHTIANLISHYLATGQRVLVTAQTAQALEVLRDKMPVELQDLCVCLLGDTRRTDKDLQKSVKGILGRHQDADETDYDDLIARAENALQKTERELSSNERLLLDARAGETVVLEPVSDYRGTKAAIARQLNTERDERGWIADEFEYTSSCPAYPSGWESLAEYHERLDDSTRARLAKLLIALPFDPAEAQTLLREISVAKATIQQTKPISADLSQPPVSDPAVLGQLMDWLRSLEEIETRTGALDREWLLSLRSELVVGDCATWKARLTEAEEALGQLGLDTVSAIVNVEVGGRSRSEALRDLTALASHYASRGRRRRLFVFKPPVVKRTEWIETSVHVGGVSIRTPEDVERAKRACHGLELLDAAWRAWTPWSAHAAIPPRQQVAALQSRRQLLKQTLELADASAELPIGVRRWLADALRAGRPTDDLIGVVSRLQAESSLAMLRQRRDVLAVALSDAIEGSDVVPAFGEIVQALVLEDQNRLAAGLSALADERARREQHQPYVAFLEVLRTSAPRLAEAIRDAEGTADWRERFLGFEQAWLHRRAAVWLKAVIDESSLDAVNRNVLSLRQRAQDELKELTAARAWKTALDRISDLRRASLVAWTRAVAAIPATGMSVFRRRAAARRYLSGSLEAIPAWVVSLSRLYETVEPKAGLFDIAIVDEASQCWLDALLLFYLAKQVIVVGDDKQISPMLVGVPDSQIAELANTFLADFEFRGSFTVESSLFDHAQRYLPAGVPLREHFRCVPEIIRFSNELCYSDRPLIPLRSVGRDRLEPLKRTYLSDGLRHGDVNDREAQAIAEAVAACNEDEAYDDAEFGVICLQGDTQAARIEQLILDRLGPGIFDERRLRCGNPYAFQGDERDVMFLSMVAAPNWNNKSLTTRIHEQRFNVALSRGRDQLWLFHSIQEHDLGPNCLRRRVLEFFRQPPDLAIRGVVPDIPTLQLRAARAHRSIERPPEPFDSWFEVDVALALVARGYRLSAQVMVGRKRIDLVIEGEEGRRLAVECDGDAWHGPEQYEEDMFRQRQLERAEWRFARVRESLFHAGRERAVAEVIAAAEDVGIFLPGAARSLHAEVSAAVPIPTSEDEGAATASLDFTDVEREVETLEQFPVPVEAADQPDEAPAETRLNDYPDPRQSSPANVCAAVMDIVRSQGPLTRQSLYRLYVANCSRISNAGRHVREAIDAGVRQLARRGEIELRDEGGRRDPTEVVLKTLDQPWVRLRPGGARELDDVPLSELAFAAEQHDPAWMARPPSQRVELLRGVARQYGLQRVRATAAERLKAADRFATTLGSATGQRGLPMS